MNPKQRQQLEESYSHELGKSPPTSRLNRNVRGYPGEPTSRLGLLVKCAACVALLTLLVVIGIGADNAEMSLEVRSDVNLPASITKSSTAAASRKEVFDARRARYESDDPGKRYAAAATPVDPANPNDVSDETCSGGVNGGMDASGHECSKGTSSASR